MFTFAVAALSQSPGEKLGNAGLGDEARTADSPPSWKSLNDALQAAARTPSERIALVDQWRQANEPSRARLPVRAPVIKPLAVNSTTPGGAISALDQVQIAIDKELEPLRAAQISGVERIRQADIALEKVSSLLATRRRIVRETSPVAATDRRLRLESIAASDGASVETRAAVEIWKLMDDTKGLSPTARIAAIDARKAELDPIKRGATRAARPTTVHPLPTGVGQ